MILGRTVARIRLLSDSLQRLSWFWGVALVLGLLAAVALSLMLGAVHVPSREIVQAALDPAHPHHTVVWEIRAPRIVAAVFTGSALAVAGALMQTVVRNPLADPGIVGVSAGAGVAALLAIVLVPAMSWLIPLFAFGGGTIAVTIILLVAFGSRRPGPLKIILSGVAVQSVLFSVIALITFFFADRAPAFAAFTIGSLNGTGWSEARLSIAPAAIGIFLAIAGSRPLNVLLFDDATAGGVGLDVVRARIGASIVAALLAASAAAVAGLIGFVGLVVPNLVRIVSGPDHRRLIPLTALGGALLMLSADLVARTLVAPLELPAGAVLALIGGPYLLILLWRKLP